MKTPKRNNDSDQQWSIFDVNGADRKNFQKNFNSLPFVFQHQLSTDPRFEMDAVRALALRLPRTGCFSGNNTVLNGWDQPGISIENALNKLESGGSWIILKRVHEDPQYASLLPKCLSEIEKLAGRGFEKEIESRTMSLILSSAGQVTPYHIDADCNFLFQIRGAKAFYVFNGRDRSILPEIDEENFWSGDINAAKFREENQEKAWAFELKPGNGVHVPVIFPHWVRNKPAVSMSLSINFRFRGSKYANIYKANHLIRRLGLHPRPVGQSKILDTIKVSLFSICYALLG